MANELYALFDVHPEVDHADLRRAYFKALRKHPAERAPLRHQELRQAYAILADPQQRQEYDGLQEGGGEVGRLMDEGNAAFSEERWDDASRSFKRALALSPDHLPARLQLARTLALRGDRDAAFRILSKAAPRSDDLALHAELGWVGLSDVVEATENEPANLNSAQKQRLLAARDAFNRCIEVSPTMRAGYYGRARLSYYRENWGKARTWAQKSIDAGGVPDFEDYPAMALIAETHILQGEPAAAARVIRAIEGITPDQPEVKAYAAEQFIRLGLMFMQGKRFEYAVEIFKACKSLHPEEDQLEALINSNLLAANAYSEYERLKNDDSLLPVAKGLALWSVAHYAGEFDDDEPQGEQFLGNVLKALDSFPARTVKAQLRLIRSKYPSVWKSQAKFLNGLVKVANEADGGTAIAHSGGTAVEEAGCGCVFLFGVLGLGSIGAGIGALQMLV